MRAPWIPPAPALARSRWPPPLSLSLYLTLLVSSPGCSWKTARTEEHRWVFGEIGVEIRCYFWLLLCSSERWANAKIFSLFYPFLMLFPFTIMLLQFLLFALLFSPFFLALSVRYMSTSFFFFLLWFLMEFVWEDSCHCPCSSCGQQFISI